MKHLGRILLTPLLYLLSWGMLGGTPETYAGRHREH